MGFIGVLSGMLPGAYSATINWAPPEGRPTFDFGPAFLLREVLESCDTFQDAVFALKNTKLAMPVFFTVCGTKKGEACVVERTRTQASVRKLTGEVLTQANHHMSKRFVGRNNDIDNTVFIDSEKRAATLERGLKKVGDAKTLAQAAKPLRVPPVRNDESYQQMVFAPRTGDIHVWRWVE